MKSLRQSIGLLLLAAACLCTGPGCLGRFAMTGAVRGFNLRAFESQWPREILFLGLYIVPVYPFCAFADLLVVNSIEFWTGSNPIDGEKALTLTAAEGARREEERAVAARASREESAP